MGGRGGRREGVGGGATFWTNGAEQQGRCKEWSDVNNLEVAVSRTEWETDGHKGGGGVNEIKVGEEEAALTASLPLRRRRR